MGAVLTWTLERHWLRTVMVKSSENRLRSQSYLPLQSEAAKPCRMLLGVSFREFNCPKVSEVRVKGKTGLGAWSHDIPDTQWSSGSI